jgi:hypothetical protein
MKWDFSVRELALIRPVFAETYNCSGNAVVSMYDAADYNAVVAERDALLAKLAVAVEALEDIGRHEPFARSNVNSGFYNTTLPIDMAGSANAALTKIGPVEGEGEGT